MSGSAVKLAAVLRAGAADALLDTYESERHPVRGPSPAQHPRADGRAEALMLWVGGFGSVVASVIQ